MHCRSLVAVVSGLILAGLVGCAAPISVKYPEYAAAPSLSVSSSTLNTWTETPAADVLLPDSQVFIAGNPQASKFLGLLGVAIDRGSTSSQAGDRGKKLEVKFHEQTTASLRSRSGSTSAGRSFQVLEPDAKADITVIPQARVEPRADGLIASTWRLTAKFRDAPNNRDGVRNYAYISKHILALSNAEGTGWGDNNNRRFQDESNKAIELLSEVLAEDLAGKYAAASSQQNPARVQWRPATNPALLLQGIPVKESPTQWVLIPVLRDRPLTGWLYVIEKESMKIE